MKSFEFVRARTVPEAAALLGTERDSAKILAGGTDLLGEMKEYLVTPTRLVNIKTIPNLGKIEHTDKGTRIGALVTLTRLAEDAQVKALYPVLVQAVGFSAMPQIRNAATIGGNLCQRPRCWYYRDEHTVCLKKGGQKCYAVDGENEYHAILGGGPCYIVHPSDPAPALLALGASVVLHDGQKERTVPLEEFFVLPQKDVHRENILAQNEIITHVLIPAPAVNSAYVKEREKDSYDWALSAAAVALTLGTAGIAGGGRVVSNARIVLGGVAPIPWRATAAEKALTGKPISDATIAEAAKAAVADAKPLAKNAYKIPLTEVVVRRAIQKAAAGPLAAPPPAKGLSQR
jgi:xanthine dehydrogenase YagS FAD-binding subunit